MTGTGLTCGELLRRYRLLVGLTQEELADRSGYTADYVGKLERGQRRPPIAAVRHIAAVLALGEDELSDLLVARQRLGTEPGIAPIAGRARELAELRRLLAGSGPTVLLFRGEPGVGKTRLLDEAGALASRSGWRVIRGGCRSGARDPYAPLTEAVAGSLRSLPEAERLAAVRVAGRLDLLLPELRGADEQRGAEEFSPGLGVPASVSGHERRLMFAAVVDYLLAVAGEAGTLLVLDDLQWAERDALDLLAMTAANENRAAPPAVRGRLRVVGAFRDTQAAAGSPTSEFVSELAGLSSARVLGVGALSDAESEELLRGRLRSAGQELDSVHRAIVRRADGMPLFLVSFAEELDHSDGAGVDLELPWSAAQVVRQQVADLPPWAQELLRVASVASGAVEPELLCEATSLAREDVLDALRVACDARLLTEDREGCRFVHDLVRETVAHDLSAGWSRLCHARLAGALMRLTETRRQGRAAEIAWHLEQADELEQALPWMLCAGDEATGASRFAVAERRYASAMELAGALGDERAEAEASGKLAEVLFRLTRYADALALWQRAAKAFLCLGDRDRYLTMVARSAEMYGVCGHTADGMQPILPIVQALEDPEDEGPTLARHG